MTKSDYNLNFDKNDVYPSYIESKRLKYVPLHKSDITVKKFYDKFSNISSKTTEYVTFIKPYEQIIEAKKYIKNVKRILKKVKNQHMQSYIRRQGILWD